MSYYISSPFKPAPAVLIAGKPEYVFGSWNDRTGPTFGNVLQDSSVTTTATVVFQIRSGNAPVVGSQIYVRGTANSAGVFNSPTTGIVLSAVTNFSTGVCTVTYAISSTTQGVTADAGEVEIPQPEVGEAVTDGSSVPVSLSFSTANPDEARGLTVVVSFPSIPDAAVVTLQQAVFDRDEEYADVATVVTVSGGVLSASGQITVDPTLGRFFRLHISGSSGGTLPTIVGKILG